MEASWVLHRQPMPVLALAIPLLAAYRWQAAFPRKYRLMGCAQLPRGKRCSSIPGEAFVAPSSGKEGAEPEKPKL